MQITTATVLHLAMPKASQAKRREPRIGVRAASGLLELLDELGVDPLVPLGQAELTPGALGDPDQTLPLGQFVHLLELCAQATSDDCFGAHFAGRYPIRYTGLAGYAALSSPTLGEGCRAIARYYALLADATALSLSVQGRRACLSYTLTDASIWPRRQDAECMLAVLLGWLREVLGPAFAPEEVWLEHARPTGAPELARIFKSPLRFNRRQNALLFSATLLDHALPSEHGELAPLLEPYLEQLLRKKARPVDTNDVVVEAIRSALGSGAPSLSEVACSLAMSPRTLQRRLEAQGQSFQDLLDRARHECSLAFLGDPALSIGEVAAKLGYADVTTFSRAFRRWAGTSPSQFRVASRHRVAP